ncbi:hypothetical protein MIND_00626900 [Mycena indigotica]|uniref:Transmembrane protein n=1 Tax=Mycena indigotica TaxID=2126181 RepID=A0A8H6W5W4_9AGAR|nr:uncharacterized protein MIND_00626900 [Mycena indigotica]KAF7303961.1 hypothetical protein MIND_00626900 [Mycena indigotica]
MRCSFVSVVAFCALLVAAAPMPAPEPVAREIEHAPFVGIQDVARAVPALQPKAVEAEVETEEARSCRMYSCIWLVAICFLLFYWLPNKWSQMPHTACLFFVVWLRRWSRSCIPSLRLRLLRVYRSRRLVPHLGLYHYCTNTTKIT